MPTAHDLCGVEIKNLRLSKDALPYEYRNLLAGNPLIAQIEGNLKTAGGWTELEIRTAQLCVAVLAAAELQKQVALLTRFTR